MEQNKMGYAPIPKLLISMAVPMMISMLVQALYNIVDSIFVAQISEAQLELTAVSVAFPIQNLMIAFATGFGVGFSTLISKSLGERNPKAAGRGAAQGVLIEAICYAIFLIIGLFFVRPFFESQTDNPLIVEYGVQYLSICCIFSFGVFMQIAFEKMLQATGKTALSMSAQVVGAVINIILDPVFIFGFGPIPAAGIKGAAIATVVGQVCAAIVAIILHLTKNKELRFSAKDIKPHRRSLYHIFTVGAPSVAMMAIGSVMTYLLNKILFAFEAVGEIAATVFGIYFKLQSFVFMPVFGLNNGMIPIIAYNYGAKNRHRITKTIRLAATIAVSIMLIGMLLFQLMPDKLLLMFDAHGDMMDIGCMALRKISLSFLFAGFSIIIVASFQALGNGVYSLIISFVRQLVVLIPVAALLANTAGVAHVWFAFPIAEVVAVAICTVMFIVMYKKRICPLPEGEN